MRSDCDPFIVIAPLIAVFHISVVIPHGVLLFVDVQAVEGVVLLSGKSDYSQMGVKGEGLHLVTAGSKGKFRIQVNIKCYNVNHKNGPIRGAITHLLGQ